MAAGRAGGIVIVKTSRLLRTISVGSIPWTMFLGIEMMIPTIAKAKRTIKNLAESEWNLNLDFLGKRIDLTSAPLAVRNPVLVTRAKTPELP